jgi:hypothetical protein
LSFICSPERQAHGEGRSLVVAGAFRANFAVIRLDDRPGDSEPEPQGAKLLRDGFIGSMPTVWLAVLACFGSFGLPQTSAAAKPDQSDKPDFSGTRILDRQASTSFDPLRSESEPVSSNENMPARPNSRPPSTVPWASQLASSVRRTSGRKVAH